MVASSPISLVCVWCWNHIMEMVEKDETEGRCPACRTPYGKEKIVGTTSKCERLAAEISMEKKKSQKSKIKTSEGRKQLSSVRVIQRNLVYIVGLPLELADEDLLLHKEYFGQYGKVLKVSISRTSAGTIQQFANNTCSVSSGCKVEDPDMLERIRLTVINNLLKYHPESSELLAMGEAFGIKPLEKKPDVDIATHIHIREDGPKRRRIMHTFSRDLVRV